MPQVPSLIAIASGQNLIIWNVTTDDDNPVSRQITCTSSIVSVAWNHNGQAVAVCCKTSDYNAENCVSLYSVQSGENINSFGKDSLQGCQQVRFAAKSRLLCCTCNNSISNFVSVWDLKRMNEARKFEEKIHPLLSSSLDLSDTFVYSLSQQVFSIYRLKEAQKVGDIICEVGSNVQYTCFDSTFFQDKNLIALGDSLGQVKLFDLEGMIRGGSGFRIKPLIEMNFDQNNNNPDSSASNAETLQISFSDELIAILQQDRLIIYNWLNRLVVTDVKMKNAAPGFYASCFCWNGSVVALGFQSGNVILLDWRTQQQIDSYQISYDENVNDNQRMSVDNLSFSPQQIKWKPPDSSVDVAQVPTVDKSKTALDHSANIKSGSNTGASRLFASSAAIEEMVRSEINKQDRRLLEKDATAIEAMKSNGIPWKENPLKEFTSDHDPLIISNLNAFNCETQSSPGPPSSYAASRFIDGDTLTSFVHAEQRMLSSLRDEINEALANMHANILRQFRVHSEEMNLAMSKQLDVLERMADENHELRVENSRLREIIRKFRDSA